MALIACTKCGHTISSLARFCPKCNLVKNSVDQNIPRLIARSSTDDGVHAHKLPPGDDSTSYTELLQRQFKPSLDEMITLEGRCFLIKSAFNIRDCYAYLTSKRYVLCDASRENIVFQVAINGIVFAEEGRHLISKKIVLTTTSGETLQVKSQPHLVWLRALQEPRSFTDAAKKAQTTPLNTQCSSIDWFYDVDGISVGPVKENIIVQLIQNNHTIFSHTKVRNANLPEWKRADETILTIYFREPAAPGEDLAKATSASGMPGVNLFQTVMRLFSKYF